MIIKSAEHSLVHNVLKACGLCGLCLTLQVVELLCGHVQPGSLLYVDADAKVQKRLVEVMIND